MVIGYHLIWVAYGWWLGNDPRGGISKWIRSDLISELGNLHQGRKGIQPKSFVIREFYECAIDRLKFPLLTFDEMDILHLAQAIKKSLQLNRYTCYACAIMPDHIHILIRKHKHLAEQMIVNLQRETHLGLREAGARDMDHPIWGGHGWKVYLDQPEDIRRTIPYIEQNPMKMGLARQEWDFITPYDNWPFHRRGG